MGKINLAELSTRAPKEIGKEATKKETFKILDELDDLQNLLFAESKHAVLIVLQAMDAGGKDGLIRDVFGNMNPQGVSVKSFKAPTDEELSHDFLWRIHKHTPQTGMIKVFNRSHYEDILITRVKGWCDDETAKKRMSAINDFEKLLTNHNNTTILKFYLHISPEEQQERLKERIQNPAKQWKYNANDFEEAKSWDKYMSAYEDAFENCNEIPWDIIPADQNWYKEYLVAVKLHETLTDFKMKYPGMKK